MKKNRNKEKLIERILKDKTLRREITSRDFEWFFTIYYSRYIKYETPEFHREMFRILQSDDIELAIFVAFRGSAKSTVITNAYIIWSILGRQQKKFVTIQSQTEQKARQFLMNIKRELEQNALLRSDLGPFQEEKSQWGSQALIISRLKARITIGSVEQSIRGSLFGEFRPDLIVLDDVEDTNMVKTQEGRNKIFDWFTGEVIPAGDRGTKIVAVGNLLHEDSLLKRLQNLIETGKTEGVYREFPIIDDDGNPAWPGKFPNMESIEKLRAKVMNDVSWHREFLLRIVSSDEQIIRPEWIQHYDKLPSPTDHTYFATGIDLAISQKENADYTAMVSGQIQGRYSKDMVVYIIPNIINRRLTSLGTIDTAKAISDSFRPKGKLWIESNGYQESLIEHLEAARYPAEGVRSRGDKYSRLNSVSHLVQNGQVMFPRHGAGELITQLLGFGIEKHDDLVDAFAILLLKVAEKWSVKRGSAGVFADGKRADAI